MWHPVELVPEEARRAFGEGGHPAAVADGPCLGLSHDTDAVKRPNHRAICIADEDSFSVPFHLFGCLPCRSSRLGTHGYDLLIGSEVTDGSVSGDS